MKEKSIIPLIITMINITVVIIGFDYLASTDYKKSMYLIYERLALYIRFSFIPAIISVTLAKFLPQGKYSKANYYINFIYIIFYIIFLLLFGAIRMSE